MSVNKQQRIMLAIAGLAGTALVIDKAFLGPSHAAAYTPADAPTTGATTSAPTSAPTTIAAGLAGSAQNLAGALEQARRLGSLRDALAGLDGGDQLGVGAFDMPADWFAHVRQEQAEPSPNNQEQPAATSQPTASSGPELKFTGIILGSAPRACINGRWLSIGDSVDGYQLVRVEDGVAALTNPAAAQPVRVLRLER